MDQHGTGEIRSAIGKHSEGHAVVNYAIDRSLTVNVAAPFSCFSKTW